MVNVVATRSIAADKPPGIIAGWFFFAVILLLFTQNGQTADVAISPQIQSQQELENRIAASATWRRLLHFRPEQNHSDVLSPEFFLSSNGPISPITELQATLEAFQSRAKTENPNLMPHCRFPARYLWLSEYFQFPHSLTDCTKFQQWAKLDQLESVSIILVSAYFSNPASSFGHALLKINNQDFPTELGLLDISVNYGALVPENEWMPAYVVKGLLGGYKAGFSDKLYYSHDQVYSETEFRDAWEYTLNLTTFQQQLLVSHVWEITGKKYQYYFLKENCAYRLAELFELVLDQDITSHTRVWYAPIDLFHDLDELTVENGKPALKHEKFIPSRERILYHELSQLGAKQQQQVLAFIGDPHRDLQTLNNGMIRDNDILDTLLNYYQFRLAGLEEFEAPELLTIQQQLLSTRLRLPVTDTPLASRKKIVALQSPLHGEKPGRISVGAAHNRALGNYTTLGYSAYVHERIGDNTLSGSSLGVFSLNLGRTADGDGFINRFDLIMASKNTLHEIHIPGEDVWSWDLSLGARRESLTCLECSTAYGSYSLGWAFQPKHGVIFQLSGLLEYQDSSAQLKLMPVANFTARTNNRYGLHITYRHDLRNDTERQPDISMEFRYSLLSQVQLKASINSYRNNPEYTESNIALQWRI